MSDDDALDLLRRVVRNNLWRIRLTPDKDEAAGVLCSYMACQGGDNTCFLMMHYRKGLQTAIRKELDNETLYQ